MMITCTKVLYCTDFSESAKAALPFAIDIAKKYGATLHLVSVHQDPDHMAEFETSSNIKMDWIRVARSIGTETEKKLQALCDEVSREWKACQFKMLRGTPFREIVTYARDNTIDLVVMSSRGLSGLEHVLFGSTAERVLRESPCHVLVIKAMKK